MSDEKKYAIIAKFFRYTETTCLWLLFFVPVIGFIILDAAQERVLAIWIALVLSAIGSHFCASHYEALLNTNEKK